MKSLVETSKEIISEVSIGLFKSSKRAKLVELDRETIDRLDLMVDGGLKTKMKNNVIFFQKEGFDESDIVSYFAYLASRYL
jgi:hypothetical protein